MGGGFGRCGALPPKEEAVMGSEKRLRDVILSVKFVAPVTADLVTGALDALLAEHRTKVEALTAASNAARQSADDWKVCAERERDAALEEAARAADSEGVSDNRTSRQRAASVRANIIAERIRALKSQPATFAEKRAELLAAGDPDPTTGAEPARQYVDAEKVREVLLQVGAFSADPARTEHGKGVEYAVWKVADYLGVDLDVKPTASEADLYEQGGFIPPEG